MKKVVFTVDISVEIRYTNPCPVVQDTHGGIAQLARACGSYPQCPRFKSRCRYHYNQPKGIALRFYIRPGGQAVKTPPFHGGNTGSIPVRVTITPAVPPFGGIAQLVERPPHTRKVTDSSSVVSTNNSRILSDAGIIFSLRHKNAQGQPSRPCAAVCSTDPSNRLSAFQAQFSCLT